MGHFIEAKFEDDQWLHEFQSKQVQLAPGDSIKVILQEEISYGYDSEVVSARYTIKKVIEVIPAQVPVQQGMYF